MKSNNAPTITPRESDMIRVILNNDAGQGPGRLGGVWAYYIMDKTGNEGVLGSLVKKGLATSTQEEDGQWCQLTDLGADVADTNSLRPSESA